MGRLRFAIGNQASRRPRCFSWMASQLLAVAGSRSWELGRGPTGDCRGGVSNLRSHTNHGQDRRQPSRLECSDGRRASVVGPKPPKGNYRWGPKILGARCSRATCAGPKPGLTAYGEESLRQHVVHQILVKLEGPISWKMQMSATCIDQFI